MDAMKNSLCGKAFACEWFLDENSEWAPLVHKYQNIRIAFGRRYYVLIVDVPCTCVQTCCVITNFWFFRLQAEDISFISFDCIYDDSWLKLTLPNGMRAAFSQTASSVDDGWVLHLFTTVIDRFSCCCSAFLHALQTDIRVRSCFKRWKTLRMRHKTTARRIVLLVVLGRMGVSEECLRRNICRRALVW